MTDNKRNTRHKILGELESIKTLLEDKLNEDEDLPDAAADDDDAPLLTDALNSVIEDITNSESRPTVHDIPVLQTAVDESDWPPATDETSSEDDDIVARALKARAPGKATPSLFDGPETDDSAPAASKSAQAPQQHVEQPTEQQPSLFGPDHDDSVAEPTIETPVKPVAKQAPTTTVGNPPAARRAPATSANKTENPFLPKHIRDRLAASRALQQSADYPRPATKPEDLDPSDAELVEQIVQEYLPKVEAELRKKIRALIRDEREIAEKSS